MLETIVLAAAIAGGPDHITLLERSVDMKTPTAGAFAEQIESAARVPKKWRPFARCVLDRESGGTLEQKNSGEGARNPRSSASGRWQMLDGQGWRTGAAWMVQKRLVEFGVPKPHTKEVRLELRSKPIHKWDGHWQDIAFIASVTEGGWFHWRNGGRCDGLRPHKNKEER